MSVICKFIDFIFIKVQIFPSFSQGKQNICKLILQTFHEFILILYGEWLW